MKGANGAGNTTATIIYDGQRNKGERGIIGTCSHKADQTVKQWHSPTLAYGYVSHGSGCKSHSQ